MSHLECACIPQDAVILNTLAIVEYLGSDGEIYKQDLSCAGDGDELSVGKAFELLEWGRAMTISPIIADMVHDYVFGDDDGGEEAIV